MTKTYGIPNVVSSSELFHFNNGQGKLRIMFEGGIPDDKNNIPATYTTADEFEQIVIENSNMFGRRIFLYNNKGQVIQKETASTLEIKDAISNNPEPKPKKANSGKAATEEYPEVKSLGDATEVLLSLGVPAEDLSNVEGVINAMLAKKVKFPNLKLK